MDSYRTVRELGAGGYGKAILVQSLQDSTLKVVKEIDTTKLPERGKMNAKREVQVLMKLRHSNIIRYRGHVEGRDKITILMDYAPGGDLEKLIKSRNEYWPEEVIVDWFVQMCLAVKYIHDRKIVHRDIKPANFFISEGGIIKLGDFGLAQYMLSTDALLMTLIGSPFYLAPELCSGKKYNSKADIWSLGCVLYEMCALKRAYRGHSVREVVEKIIKTQPKKLPSCFSTEIRVLLMLMLNKNPDKRPSINEILTLPFIRYKAIALLGKTQASVELSHTTFHGEIPGRTPIREPQDVYILNERISLISSIQSVLAQNDPTPNLFEDLSSGELNEEKIEFMGRTLILPHLDSNDSPGHKAEALREFLEYTIGVTKFHDIYVELNDNPGNNSGILACNIKTDKWIVDLIMQLIVFEEAANNQ